MKAISEILPVVLRRIWAIQTRKWGYESDL
ncbi:MAG: hypothetical protein A4E54_02372 [Pelotomaculum sp. PtaB.Bin117]|nr:MAG: hypothetical protein A4E54_02372 [Pelotomaculum sp. PtaB.Bin117]